MSPVEQQRCIPGGCVVGEGDRSPVQQLQSNLGETLPGLQFFGHCYSLYLATWGLEIRAKYTMPDAEKGCVIKGLVEGVGRIGASIDAAARPVNNVAMPGLGAPPY